MVKFLNLRVVVFNCYTFLEIGREFVRQYYTMLSERPQDVFRFYSHESYFAHDTDQPVQGQQVAINGSVLENIFFIVGSCLCSE